MPPTYRHDEIAAAIPKATQHGTALGDGVDAAIKVARKAVGAEASPAPPHPPAAVLAALGRHPERRPAHPPGGRRRGAQGRHPDLDRVARHARRESSTPPLRGGNTEQDPVSRRPAATLQGIAKATGGTFFAAASPADLKRVYEDLGSRLLHEKRWKEITVAVTAAALVLILAGAVLSGLWFRRVV